MSENENAAVSAGLETLSGELKRKIIASGMPLNNIDELNAAIESVSDKAKRAKEFMPDISVVASSMECTGLIPSQPQNVDEYSSRQELYSTEIPNKKKSGYDGQEKNISEKT